MDHHPSLPSSSAEPPPPPPPPPPPFSQFHAQASNPLKYALTKLNAFPPCTVHEVKYFLIALCVMSFGMNEVSKNHPHAER